MNVWAWFAVPPVVLLAAYYALGPLEKNAVKPLTPPPAIESLRLPEGLTATAGKTGYQRGGVPKGIRLSAFGVVVPEEVTGKNTVKFTPPASELFALQSVLLAGDNFTATINGKLYKKGDKLGQRYQLVKIEANTVWLNGPLGREAIRFPEFVDPPVQLAAAQAPPLALQAPGKPSAMQMPGALPMPSRLPPAGLPGGSAPGQLDSEYRKILEMLKL